MTAGASPISSAHVAAWLAAYDAFGSRRTGSPGDIACAKWLAAQLDEARVAARLVEVPLQVRTVIEAALEGGSLRIDGLPLFDAPDTPAEGITGVLTTGKEGGDLGVIEAEPGAASIKGQALEQLRRATQFRALVIATRGAAGTLAPINAQFFDAPFGPPMLQIAGAHFDALSLLARQQAPGRIIVRTQRTAGHSFNVDAHIGERPALVLLTPRTSWWESTAERAGGIVAWLEGLRHAAARGVGVRAFSTCGHELGHLGLECVLHEHRALVKSAPLWLHLGANLGCASDGRVTVRASEPNDAERMRELLVLNGYPQEHIELEPIDRAMGEARDLDLAGARVLSMIGRNAHFHAPSDRWPGNVNAGWVASIARAVCGVIG
jgi:hypothetical protein